ASLQGGQQPAVRVAEHVVLRTDHRPRRPGLGPAAIAEGRPAERLVPGAAIRHANQLQSMAAAAPERGTAAGLQVGVVGVGAENEDAEGGGQGCFPSKRPASSNTEIRQPAFLQGGDTDLRDPVAGQEQVSDAGYVERGRKRPGAFVTDTIPAQRKKL